MVGKVVWGPMTWHFVRFDSYFRSADSAVAAPEMPDGPDDPSLEFAPFFGSVLPTSMIRHPCLAALLSLLGVLGILPTSAQSTVTFDLPPGDLVADTGFPVRITILRPDGTADAGYRGPLDLRAYRWTDASPVISEISLDGELIEITQVGAVSMDLDGWELEAIQSTTDPVHLVRQRIPAWLLNPGGTLVWTSRTNETLSGNHLIASAPLNPSGRVVAYQLRDPSGRLMDQVWTRVPSYRRTEPRWFAYPLDLQRGESAAWVRRGAANHFSSADWHRDDGSPGELNPGLSVPWRGTRSETAVEPAQVQVVDGVWTGTVTLATAGPALSLAAGVAPGTRWESTPFPVIEAPRDPQSGAVRRLDLALTTDPGNRIMSEAAPGVRVVTLTAIGASGGSQRVSLASDAPGEITGPAEVMLPQSPPYQTTFTVTNVNDTIADGRAVVTVTATASGFAPAHLTLFNDDDESGTLYLQAPHVVAEGSGFPAEPTRTVLPMPASHPVQVLLTAEAPLEVPDAVIIPAGESGVLIPLRVGGDSAFNQPGRSAKVFARIPGWPVAEAALLIVDDETAGLTVEWPTNLVEGAVAWGTVRFLFPRDHETELTFQSDAPRFLTPPPVRVPAGVAEMPFSLPVPDNSEVDGPSLVQVCAGLDGVFTECRELVVADDEISSVVQLLTLPPEAVFSGEPFPMQIVAIDTFGVPPRTNFPGTITVLASPELARFQSDPNPVSLTHGLFHGQLTLEGEALGLELGVEAAGLTLQSRPIDLIRGFWRPGPFLDLAALPGREHLLLSVGTETNATGMLQELNSETGTVAREIPLTHPALQVAVSADGSVAWLALVNGTLLRVSLEEWRVTGEVRLGSGSEQRIARALAVLPGSTERVLVLVSPSVPDGTESQVVAYDQGRRLGSTVPVNAGFFMNLIQPGRSPEEAFVGFANGLFRVRVTPDGVAVLSQVGSVRPFVLLGDSLISGEGRIFQADTLELMGEFAPVGTPGWDSLWSVVMFPELGRAGFVDRQGQFRLYDLADRSHAGMHRLPYNPDAGFSESDRLIRVGSRRIAGLINSGKALRVWESPLTSSGTADLRVSVEAPKYLSLGEPYEDMLPGDWKIRVTVTNQGPDTAFALVLSDENAPPQSLGSLPPGQSRTTELRRSHPTPALLHERISVMAGTRDPNLNDNLAIAETAMLPEIRRGVGRIALAMNHLVGEPDGKRLYAALSRRPGSPAPAIALIQPETASVEHFWDTDGEPRRLAVSTSGERLFAMVGSNVIARWNLPQGTPETPLDFGAEQVLDMLPLPGAGDRLAVATSESIRIFEGTTESAFVEAPPAARRDLGYAAERLWIAQFEELQSYRISATGLVSDKPAVALPWFLLQRHFSSDSTRLYFRDTVFDIGTEEFRNDVTGDIFISESSRNAIYSAQFNSLYRHRHDTLEFDVSEPVPAPQLISIDELARWGSDGVAIRSGPFLLTWSSSLVPEGASDLGIRLSVSPSSIAGMPFTATVTVTNRGPDAAARTQIRLATIHDALIPDLAAVPLSAESFFGSWILDVPLLASGAEAQLSLSGTQPSRGISFRAWALAGALDPNPSDNAAEFSVFVPDPAADLGIHHFTLPARVAVGETFEASVVVTNRGPNSTPWVNLYFSRRSSLELLSVEGGMLREDCCDLTFLLHSPIALHAGEQRTFILRFRAAQPSVVLLSAEVASPAVDPQPDTGVASHLLSIVRPDTGSAPVTSASLIAWSDRRQEFAASLDGIPILISKSLDLVQMLPLPRQPIAFHFSPDGRHLWTAFAPHRIVRLDLQQGIADLDFQVREGLVTPSGALLTLEGKPDVLLAAGMLDGQPQVTAYDSGIPRPESYTDLQWWGYGVVLTDGTDQRAWVTTGGDLRELELTERGLIAVRNLDVGATPPFGSFTRIGGHLYFGDGQVTDLSTGNRTALAVSVVDPVTSLGYLVEPRNDTLPHHQVIRAFGLPESTIRWRTHADHPAPWQHHLLPMGTNGVLAVGESLIVIPAPAADSRVADLSLSAAVDVPILGTNQWFPLQLAVSHQGNWAADDVILEVSLPAGIQPEIPADDPIRFPLGTLLGDTNFLVVLRATAPGPQSIRVSVVSTTPDPATANNVVDVSVVAPPPPQLILADQRIVENDALFPSHAVLATLTSPAPMDLEIQVALEPVTAQAEDLTDSVMTLRFGKGESRTSFNPIRSDSTPEPDETFWIVFISGPVQPVRRSALITIVNDDLPRLRSRGGNAFEGAEGLSEFRVPVSLSASAPFSIEVTYRLVGITASPGSDFLPRSGRLLFFPGTLTQFVTVPILGDRLFEPDEELALDLEDLSAGFYETAFARINIPNDDPPPAPWILLEVNNPPLGRLRFNTVPGVRYTLQSRTNLSIGAWEDVSQPSIGDGSPATLDVPLDASGEVWFRIRAE